VAKYQSAANGIFEFVVDISLFGKPSSRLVQQTVEVCHIERRKQVAVVQLTDEILFL
jgi:hypothetical protein